MGLDAQWWHMRHTWHTPKLRRVRVHGVGAGGLAGTLRHYSIWCPNEESRRGNGERHAVAEPSHERRPAGNPTVHTGDRAGSANVNADNMFNAPDGIAFDSQGRLWIQTDGKYSDEGDFAGQGNNTMLVGDPASGAIRRFLVGPRECEVTGIAWSADRTTLFVGIQHPGEKGGSHFPEGGEATPPSAVVAIARDDGGEIG